MAVRLYGTSIYWFLFFRIRLAVFCTQIITRAVKTTIRTKGLAMIHMVQDYT